MAVWDGPVVEAWAAWTPAEAAERLAGVGVPWCVVAGWSIDLFLGEQTREHGDLEIEILRDDYSHVRLHLDMLEMRTVVDGTLTKLPDGDLPGPLSHQNWGFDAEEQVWRIDVMLEDGDADTWTCRRHETITAPRAHIVTTTADGIPYLRPEGSLLYKAKAKRPKDEADLAAALPHMDADAKAWLVDALTRAHPSHEWIERIARAT